MAWKNYFSFKFYIIPNHVWSYDFMHDRTYDGKAFRIINILDEYTRECLLIRVDRKFYSENVIDVLTDL